MAKRQITLEEVTDFLLTLPYSDFKNVVNQYSNHTQSNFDQEMNILVKLNFQSLVILGAVKLTERNTFIILKQMNLF